MTGVTGPNSPFYEGGDNPNEGEINIISGPTFTMFEEEHDWDLNYETDKCHNFEYRELGYLDESNVFHPFTNVEITLGWSQKYTATTIMSSFFNQMFNEFSSNTYINWVKVNNTKYSFNATVSVKDSGFEKTYTGNCYMYNYL